MNARLVRKKGSNCRPFVVTYGEMSITSGSGESWKPFCGKAAGVCEAAGKFEGVVKIGILRRLAAP